MESIFAIILLIIGLRCMIEGDHAEGGLRIGLMIASGIALGAFVTVVMG